MAECCCSTDKPDTESIPTGWQCPCCQVVYAPNVDACYCCVEELEIAPDAAQQIPVLHTPGSPPPNPWFYTIQPPPYYTNVEIKVEAFHAEG